MRFLRILTGFLKREKTSAVFLLVYSAVFFLVVSLSGVGTDYVGYALLLSIFLCLMFMMIKFAFYYKKIKRLELVLENLPDVLETPPEPEDLSEELYIEITEKMKSALDEAQNTALIRETDTKDYYTLWVHQIKTPLFALRLLLSRDCPENKELMDEVFKIEQYVDMNLCYQRLFSSSSDFDFRVQPLDDILRRSIRKFSSRFIMKKISLNYEPSKAKVLTDEKWLGFVFEQLLSNSLKYTQEGSISVSSRTIDSGDGTNDVLLTVSDTGIGIAPEDVPRVFERGFTGYNGRSDKKSTGLGLYLCKEICSKLGHEISVTSAVGKGTSMLVLFHDCGNERTLNY